MAEQKLTAKLGLDKREFDKGMKSATGSVNGLAKAATAAFGTLELMKFSVEVTKLAAKAESVRAAFNRIATPGMLNELRRATQNTVSDLVLMQNTVKANNFRLPLEQLPKYFEFATRRARETGEAVDYLVDSIVLGISRESPKILDNLGLSLSEINEELKKTPDYATAVGNIIDREMKKAGKAVDDAYVQIASFQTAWENLKEGIGKKILDLGITQQMQAWSELMRMSQDTTLSKEQKKQLRKTILNPDIEGGIGAYTQFKQLQEAMSQITGYLNIMGGNIPKSVIPPIKEKEVETLQTLNDELAKYEENILSIPTAQEAEIQSTLKTIEALKKKIDELSKIHNYTRIKGISGNFNPSELGWNWTHKENTRLDQTNSGLVGVDKMINNSNMGVDLGQMRADYFSDKLLNVSDNINNIQLALENLFSTGMDGWKSFGQAAAQTIKQISAQIAAKAAVWLLFSLVTGGTSTVANLGKFSSYVFGGLKMADGGLAFGPQIAMIGEYAGASTNPEVVAPLNKLKGLMGGSQTIEVVGNISGMNIHLSGARAMNNFDRWT